MISSFLAGCKNKGAVKRRLSSIYSADPSEETLTPSHDVKVAKCDSHETAGSKVIECENLPRKSSSFKEEGISTDDSDMDDYRLNYRALLKLQKMAKSSHCVSDASHLLYPESPLSVGSTCAGSRASRKDSLIDEEFRLASLGHDDHFGFDTESMVSMDTTKLSTSSSSTSSDSACKQRKRELEQCVLKRGGEIVCSHTFELDCEVFVRCHMGHTFHRKVEELLQAQWCTKCDEELAKVREYAKSRGGVLLNSKLSETIEFECHQGHRWMASYRYYRKRKWCVTCLRKQREDQKHTCLLACKESKVAAAHLQEKLFREAHSAASFRMGGTIFASSTSEASTKEGKESNFDLERAILRPHDSLIHGRAVKYVNTRVEGDNSTTYKQAYLILKIQSLTDMMLADRMNQVPQKSLSKQYKALAVRIHPDKSGHPDACHAFKKLTQLYEHHR